MGNIVIKLSKDLLRIIIRNKKKKGRKIKFFNNHITLNIMECNLMSINNEKNSKYKNQINNF
jgi:hypothetical protein